MNSTYWRNRRDSQLYTIVLFENRGTVQTKKSKKSQIYSTLYDCLKIEVLYKQTIWRNHRYSQLYMINWKSYYL